MRRLCTETSRSHLGRSVGRSDAKETKRKQKGTDHDFLACYPAGNAGYLAYAISFSHSHHYEVKHQPKGGRDISNVLLVEERSALLRSTEKIGKELEVSPTPLTANLTQAIPGPKGRGSENLIGLEM